MDELAVASLAVILYTYAGYPALVGLWAKMLPLRVSGHSGFEPTVTVCLTVYNGEPYIAAKLRSLQALDYPADKIEILVFSDGSTDSTDAVVRELAEADSRIRLVASTVRLGKPAALNRLSKMATGEVLFPCDVRQPVSPNALRELLYPLSDPRVGCVSGALVLEGATGAGVYWRYERHIREAEGRLGKMVGVSGSIYALRRSDMPELPADLLVDDMFVPLKVALSTKKSVVFAESARAFDVACDDEHEFFRKVRTLAGNYQLFARMPGLLVPGVNPVWFQMTSHKVLRLVCPWALLVLFCTSGFLSLPAHEDVLETAFWRAVFTGQVAFYLLALIGPRAGSIGGAARTFLVLNAATVVGLWRFLKGSQPVTW